MDSYLFAKNMGTHLSNKQSQKVLDSAKKSTTDAIKTASKREIQKTEKAYGDLIGNKIVDKITNSSKKSFMHSEKGEGNNEIPKERYISPEKIQVIDELRLA